MLCIYMHVCCMCYVYDWVETSLWVLSWPHGTPYSLLQRNLVPPLVTGMHLGLLKSHTRSFLYPHLPCHPLVILCVSSEHCEVGLWVLRVSGLSKWIFHLSIASFIHKVARLLAAWSLSQGGPALWAMRELSTMSPHSHMYYCHNCMLDHAGKEARCLSSLDLPP